MVDMFDYAFAENGLTAYRQSKQLSSESFISWIGEAQYKKLAKFILHYIADLDIPIQRSGQPKVLWKLSDEMAEVHLSSSGMA